MINAVNGPGWQKSSSRCTLDLFQLRPSRLQARSRRGYFSFRLNEGRWTCWFAGSIDFETSPAVEAMLHSAAEKRSVIAIFGERKDSYLESKLTLFITGKQHRRTTSTCAEKRHAPGARNRKPKWHDSWAHVGGTRCISTAMTYRQRTYVDKSHLRGLS
jgi:hypothetical protein